MHAPAIPDIDARITKLAAQQHGVVSRAQLIAAGVPLNRIEYRLKQRRLHALYSGVYRTGAVVSPHEPAMAALLACGPGAVLSRYTAGALWELLGRVARTLPLDVIVRTARRPPGPGVRVHRVPLQESEVTQRDGMPLTTPARTLLDLAAVLDVRELERAVAIAERQRMVESSELASILQASAHRPGVRALRSIVGADGSPSLTRSEAESQFLELVRRARLRIPETNTVVEGYEVDCLWRRERLIVEIDGFAFHSSPASFEQDRRRDAALTAANFRVIRVTWRQLTRDREAVLASLVLALARSARTPIDIGHPHD